MDTKAQQGAGGGLTCLPGKYGAFHQATVIALLHEACLEAQRQLIGFFQGHPAARFHVFDGQQAHARSQEACCLGHGLERHGDGHDGHAGPQWLDAPCRHEDMVGKMPVLVQVQNPLHNQACLIQMDDLPHKGHGIQSGAILQPHPPLVGGDDVALDHKTIWTINGGRPLTGSFLLQEGRPRSRWGRGNGWHRGMAGLET